MGTGTAPIEQQADRMPTKHVANPGVQPRPHKAGSAATGTALIEQQVDRMPTKQAANPENPCRVPLVESKPSALPKAETQCVSNTALALPAQRQFAFGKTGSSSSSSKLSRARSLSSITCKSDTCHLPVLAASSQRGTFPSRSCTRSSSEGRILAAVSGLDDLQKTLQAKLGRI